MSEWRTDFELLRAFVREGQQQAFADVARRHLDLVYATALRKVTDSGGAEEIAQNVFAALARKAWQFAPDDSLPSWLHRTTLLESKSWLRGEIRRRRREETAAELGTTMKTPDEQAALHALVPLLDEALLSLREQDRAALLLRYHESLSLRDVGASLGTTEEAARKRVAGSLERLADFFRRRGFKTATLAATAAVLQHTAASASAATVNVVVSASLQAAPPALAGLTAMLARLTGLSKVQAGALCLILAAAPVAWQWNKAHGLEKQMTALQSQIDGMRTTPEQLAAELDRLRTDSMRLETEITQAEDRRDRNAALTQRREEFKQKIQSLLAGESRWADDLPYTRIPKANIKDLEIYGSFSGNGVLRDTALELFAILPDEKEPTQQALENYWKGVKSLTAARAYETNGPAGPGNRITKTVITPPLGAELKTLATATAEQIAQTLGAEREKYLFGGWSEGAIQTFWPGVLFRISERAQIFKVWINPNAEKESERFGASYHVVESGGSSMDGKGSVNEIPAAVAEQFFIPWLQQHGIKRSTALGGQDE